MLKKFTTYQHLLLFQVHSSVPNELSEFLKFQFSQQKLHVVSEGSVEETRIDAIYLLEYKKNRVYRLLRHQLLMDKR